VLDVLGTLLENYSQVAINRIQHEEDGGGRHTVIFHRRRLSLLENTLGAVYEI
jgi:hypothetical protein